MANNTDSLPPFAVAQMEQVVVLTVLLSDLSLSNASWFKEHLVNFVENYRPRVLLVNLVNVEAIDRLGVGQLIGLNTQLKRDVALYFTGVQPQIEAQLKALYLRHAFRIVDPAQPCLICGTNDCAHHEEWQAKYEQFIFVEQTPPSDIPPLSDLPGYQLELQGLPEHSLEDILAAFEKDPRYQALEARRQRKDFWRKVRHYTAVGAFSASFVLGAIAVTWAGLDSRWFQVLEQAKSKMRRPEIDNEKNRVLDSGEIIDRFDKDGDGLFTREDWPYLTSGEKLIMINHGFQARQQDNQRFFPRLTP